MTYFGREHARNSLLEWHERHGKDNLGSQVQHFFDLDDDYPAAGLFGPGCISLYAGAGWAHLLANPIALIAAAGATVSQIKQKFGELIIYWDPPLHLSLEYRDWNSSGRIGPDPIYDRPDIIAIVDAVAKARRLSKHVCANCGKTPMVTPLDHNAICITCKKEERHA